MRIPWKENWPVYFLCIIAAVVVTRGLIDKQHEPGLPEYAATLSDHWVAPSLYIDRTDGFNRGEIVYGQDLIAHTGRFFGPNGSIAHISNGMNCQNCHLEAGTAPWGNNYGAVFSTYPKFRDRSGTVETISKRVNDCFERSLNGSTIDTGSREMKAIIAYISWLGAGVPRNVKPAGSGISTLSYLNRAANPSQGALLYKAKCASCHGNNGEGLSNAAGFVYPPLWGANSYNSGAGLFRLSRFAGFIKDNMPFNIASHKDPALTDAEAWDLAAFVNAQPRPQRDLSGDWPDISKKPFDHPFGPYADGFTELQHKFGPFQPIINARKQPSPKL